MASIDFNASSVSHEPLSLPVAKSTTHRHVPGFTAVECGRCDGLTTLRDVEPGFRFVCGGCSSWLQVSKGGE